jgi:outer membrane protein assembly factor BamA
VPRAAAFALAAVAALLARPAPAQTPEVVAEVRVHGNHTTPDADVLALAGLTIGAPLADGMLDRAAARLRDSGRFAGVEVRKRYRSLDDSSQILVVLRVEEHAGVTADDLTPGPLRRIRSAGMWFPILDYQEGHGLTYGARVSFVDLLGPQSRVSAPLSWGGERRAAVEVDRVLGRGPITRLEGSFTLNRRENPHYHLGDTRREARVRAERTLSSWLRVGGGARVTSVSFGNEDARFVAPGLDLVVDTRADPSFPRNAVHAVTAIEHLDFGRGSDVTRWTGEARGYVGLVGASVLALRATTSRADGRLPAYEQALLGGTSRLRGYAFGYRAGDNLAAFSAELRMPLTSPLDVGRFGVAAFIDAGTVWAAGARLRDQRLDRGIGSGIFFTAPAIRTTLDVAWPQTGPRQGRARWHFALGLTF